MANHHGDFIWYELMTTDAGAAERFYAPLLGWTFGGDAGYRHIEATEGGIGGVLPLNDAMTAGGARPAWVGYVMVEDVDKMIASIEQGGGRSLMPAQTMDGVGRIAMVTDPQGAPFYIIAPKPPADRADAEIHAFSYDRPRIGHCAWNELATSDTEAAKHFYGQRFGWVKDGEMAMGPMATYEFLRHAGRSDGSVMGQGMIGAVYPKMPEDPQPHWLFYFRVADIDEALSGIEGSGGRIHQPITEIPGGDFSLIAADPQGAFFGLVGGGKG
jgi:uncharacterized protein